MEKTIIILIQTQDLDSFPVGSEKDKFFGFLKIKHISISLGYTVYYFIQGVQKKSFYFQVLYSWRLEYDLKFSKLLGYQIFLSNTIVML